MTCADCRCRLAGRSAVRLQRNAFGLWLTRHSLQRQRRQRHCIISGRQQSQAIRRSLLQWRSAMHELRRINHASARAIARWINNACSAAFEAWVFRINSQRRLQRICKAVVRRWSSHTLASAVRAWVAFCQSQRQHRHVGAKIMRRMLNRALWHAFEGWQQSCAGMKRERTLLHRVAKRLANRTLAAAVTSWLEAMRTGRHQRYVRELRLFCSQGAASQQLAFGMRLGGSAGCCCSELRAAGG